MKAFARFIASVFMVLGVVIIFGGAAFLFSGAFGPVSKAPSPSLLPDMSGVVILARVLAGSAISLQGLFLAAIGLVLWLMVGIYEQTERTSEALSALIRRGSNQGKQA